MLDDYCIGFILVAVNFMEGMTMGFSKGNLTGNTVNEVVQILGDGFTIRFCRGVAK